MKDYISKALTKFNHFCPKKLYHSPSLYTPPKYGQKIQIADLNSTTSLSPVKIKEIQKVVGSFLFYGRVCDYTMLHALNALATAQSKGTKKTKEAMLHFLNYCATHPDATVRFSASDMILKIHSDASYLTESHAPS